MRSKNHNMQMIDAFREAASLLTKNYLLRVDGVVYAKFGGFQTAKSELNSEVILTESIA